MRIINKMNTISQEGWKNLVPKGIVIPSEMTKTTIVPGI